MPDNDNKDHQLLKACTEKNVTKLFLENATEKFDDKNKGFFYTEKFEYPLDEEIREKIKKINEKVKENSDEFEIFKCQNEIKELWTKLISKAIKCLRFFDEREPYIIKPDNQETDKKLLFTVNEEKKPSAYGVDALTEYFNKYVDFENLMYGSSNKYRDHVIHVFRTWLTGVHCLINKDGAYIKKININGKDGGVQLNYCEKLSIWTLIALTHDLGYPLEISKKILDKTHSMVSTFITNPDTSINLSFQGAQNYMNDFVVRLMSSKMEMKKEEKTNAENTEANKKDDKFIYFARLQPKYYFKLMKSLERNKHGIISTLIIYKLLIYFLESEYNINEDYSFNLEGRRQFYIRREILRSIAAHTCKDIYHLSMEAFPFLLIIADDTQEWGRKHLSDLYFISENHYRRTYIDIDMQCDGTEKNKCSVKETLISYNSEAIKALIEKLYSQSIDYIMLFRDGQDTKNRDFQFEKTCKIIYESKTKQKIEIEFKLVIDNIKKAEFSGEITYSSDEDINNIFDKKYFESIIIKNNKAELICSEKKKDGSISDSDKPENCEKIKIIFSPLS